MFGKKKGYVKLTEKDLKKLKKTLPKSEYKKLEKKMKEAEDDILWDAMTYSILFDDEDDW